MVSIVTVTFILLFAIYSNECIPAVAAAVKQFLLVVLPSIYPFYVASCMLRKTSFCEKLSKMASGIMRPLFGVSGSGAFAVVVGMVSGYPAGARVSVDLYKDGLLTKDDVLNLSSFTNNTGPLFIIGAVGAGMLGSFQYGILLWICHIVSSLLAGLVVCNVRRFFLVRKRSQGRTVKGLSAPVSGVQTKPSFAFGKSLSEAMTSSMYTMIPIAAAIVFFAAFNGVMTASGLSGLIAKYGLSFLPAPAARGVLKGFFEITGGITEIAAVSWMLPLRLAVISAVSGFAGVSVYFQVAGIYAECGIGTGTYLAGKCVHAVIAFFLAFFAASFLAC